MKNISLFEMEKIQGGSCLGMLSGFAGAVGASMAGPVGILAGAASFAYGVRQAQSCRFGFLH